MKHMGFILLIYLLAFLVGLLAVINYYGDRSPKTARACSWSAYIIIKSSIFLFYQYMTLMIPSLERWRSTAVFIVMNIIDAAFWLVLCVLMFLGILDSTTDQSQMLGMTLAILSFILYELSVLAIFAIIRDEHRAEEERLTLSMQELVTIGKSPEPQKETKSV